MGNKPEIIRTADYLRIFDVTSKNVSVESFFSLYTTYELVGKLMSSFCTH